MRRIFSYPYMWIGVLIYSLFNLFFSAGFGYTIALEEGKNLPPETALVQNRNLFLRGNSDGMNNSTKFEYLEVERLEHDAYGRHYDVSLTRVYTKANKTYVIDGFIVDYVPDGWYEVGYRRDLESGPYSRPVDIEILKKEKPEVYKLGLNATIPLFLIFEVMGLIFLYHYLGEEYDWR